MLGQYSQRSKVGRIAVGIAGVMCLMYPAAAWGQDDDWPIRLTLGPDRPSVKNQWVVRAENLADFRCTKLQLEVTSTGGRLLGGGGQSRARLVDGKLVYDMIPVMPPGETYEWTVEFAPPTGHGSMSITARLEYAEKHLPRPAPKRECSRYVPRVGADRTVSELAFPTGSRDTSALIVHQIMPDEVERNAPYKYEYHVTNTTTGTLQNVVLEAFGFRNLSPVGSHPAWQSTSDGLMWMLGDLPACETAVIIVDATSPETGSAGACLSASFSNRLCANTKVVEPALKLALAAPREALVCDEIELTLTVSNPGSGTARNARVYHELPEGLVTTDGRRRIEADAGNLGPGQSKELRFRVRAERTGEFVNEATARAAGSLAAESNDIRTTFRQPVLELACTSPEQRYIGRTAAFSFEVRNLGDAPAADTVVRASVPPGAEVVSMSQGGTPGRGEVTWSLGTVAPGTVRPFSFEIKSMQAGNLQVAASANATCADAATANCQTPVIGIPAILLEVVDLEDPVEIGKQTTYLITVTNQGTAPGTNIRVACELPPEVSYVSSTGASRGTVEGNRVTFAPISSLAPKQEVEFRIEVRARGEGDARLGVEMSSDQFSSPVRETESTNVYK